MSTEHSTLLDYAEVSTPAAPAGGYGRFYFKSDHKPYYRGSTGGEKGPLLTAADLPPLAGIGASFTASGDAYYPMDCAMTLNAAAPRTAGSATFTYYKALAASPTSFSAISTSTSFAAGDILKITCASISGGYAAVSLPRTA